MRHKKIDPSASCSLYFLFWLLLKNFSTCCSACSASRKWSCNTLVTLLWHSCNTLVTYLWHSKVRVRFSSLKSKPEAISQRNLFSPDLQLDVSAWLHTDNQLSVYWAAATKSLEVILKLNMYLKKKCEYLLKVISRNRCNLMEGLVFFNQLEFITRYKLKIIWLQKL